VSVVREHTDRYPKADSSDAIYKIAQELLNDAATERFLVFMLDAKNRVTGFHEASAGSLNMSVVVPRDIYRAAVIQGASAVILCHNHPSMDTRPSREDNDTTARLKQAGDILGIRVLDHIIVGDGYYSYADAEALQPTIPYPLQSRL